MGGVCFDTKEYAGEEEVEVKRIESYYKRACADAGTLYPRDLHYNKKSKNAEGRTKGVLAGTISEFLNNGTYKGTVLQDDKNQDLPARKGEYHLYANVNVKKNDEKDNDNVNSNEEKVDTKGALLKEDVGANLYTTMAGDILSHLVFQNPSIDVQEANVYASTRKFVIDKDETDIDKKKIKADLENQGVSSFEKKVNDEVCGEVYSVTNSDFYRAALQRSQIELNKQTIEINVKTLQIEYGSVAKKNKKEIMFLYLADTICAFLNRKENGKSVENIKDIFNKANNLLPQSVNYVFSNSETGIMYRKAWQRMEEGAYFFALSMAYDCAHRKGNEKELYSEQWVPMLVQRMYDRMIDSSYEMAVLDLGIYATTNNLLQDKLLFIFKALEKLQEKYIAGRHKRAYIYALYDIGVSAFSHLGDSSTAKKYYEKCVEYADYTSVETFLNTRNKMVVFLSDCFDYKYALNIAKRDIKYHKSLIRPRKTIFGNNSGLFEYAKAESQLGQIYSFLRDSKAEKYFLSALSRFEENSFDYLITMSFLLHYYIDSRNQVKYDRTMEKYCGGNVDIEQQLDYLISVGTEKNALISLKFALYIYTKGLFEFHINDISESLKGKLIELEKNITSACRKTGTDSKNCLEGHPWELIYSYLAVILLECGNETEANNYNLSLEGFAKKAKGNNTIYLICLNRSRLWYKKIEDKIKISKYEDELKNYIVDGELSCKKNEEFEYFLDRVFTYMYI